MTKRDLALDLFRSFQTGKRTKRKIIEEKRPEIDPTRSRDPELLANVLDSLVVDRDWKSGIAEGNLFTSWNEIVGADIATCNTNNFSRWCIDSAHNINCLGSAIATRYSGNDCDSAIECTWSFS